MSEHFVKNFSLLDSCFIVRFPRTLIAMKTEDFMRHFRVALKWWIAKNGYGSQNRLAEKAGLSSSYLSEIIKEKKDGTEEKRRAIAKATGYSYEEFLALGRDLLEEESERKGIEPLPLFQSELEALGNDILAKYHLIYAKAAEETGYPGVRDYIDRALGIAPDEYKAFEAGEISAYELYELAKRTLVEDMEDIKKRMRRWEELTKDVKRKNIEDIL